MADIRHARLLPLLSAGAQAQDRLQVRQLVQFAPRHEPCDDELDLGWIPDVGIPTHVFTGEQLLERLAPLLGSAVGVDQNRHRRSVGGTCHVTERFGGHHRGVFTSPIRVIASCAVALLLATGCTSGASDTANAAATVAPAAATPTAAPTDTAAAEPSPDTPTPTPRVDETHDAEPTPAPTACGASAYGPRVDVQPTGNRLSDASVDLVASEPTVVTLPGRPAWVLATDDGWHVTFDDGSAVTVTNGNVGPADPIDGTPTTGDNGDIRNFAAHRFLFRDPLPDARVVLGGSNDLLDRAFALAGPTRRYRHNVLGDDIEAAGIEIVDLCTAERLPTIELAEPDVIEGLSPMLGDIDGDGIHEILATVSNAESGARLVAWRLDGTLLAESPPIGRGNRWRNQMAIAPVGPNGEIEVIDVRTPHIGGTVEYFRLQDGELVRVAASAPNYTSHEIGSRNLDLAVVFDATGDGQLNVIVPSKDRQQLAVLVRTDGGVDEVARRELPGRLLTNIAIAPARNEVSFGAGDQLVIFTDG